MIAEFQTNHKEENPKTDVMEPIIFCTLRERSIRNAPLSHHWLILNFVALYNYWDIRKSDGYKKSKELLIKQAQWN